MILEFDGRPIGEASELPAAVAQTAPGKNVELKVWRKNAEKEFKLKLGELDETQAATADAGQPEAGRLGLAVRPLTADERRQVGVNGGLLIEDVQGAAEDAGSDPATSCCPRTGTRSTACRTCASSSPAPRTMLRYWCSATTRASSCRLSWVRSRPRSSPASARPAVLPDRRALLFPESPPHGCIGICRVRVLAPGRELTRRTRGDLRRNGHRRRISRVTVFAFGMLLIVLSGIDILLLRHLVTVAGASASLIDDVVFKSEFSAALYLLPLVSGAVGTNLISHVLVQHLEEAEKRHEREQHAAHRHSSIAAISGALRSRCLQRCTGTAAGSVRAARGASAQLNCRDFRRAALTLPAAVPVRAAHIMRPPFAQHHRGVVMRYSTLLMESPRSVSGRAIAKETLDLVERATTDAVTDLGAKDDSVGDLLTFERSLRFAQGKSSAPTRAIACASRPGSGWGGAGGRCSSLAGSSRSRARHFSTR